MCGFHWYVWERKRPGGRPWGPYAVAYRAGRHILMHKLITGYGRSDHANHNGLDNQRSNLRPTMLAQNTANERPQSGRTSRFKGVCWNRSLGKWQAGIKINGKNYHLGVF